MRCSFADCDKSGIRQLDYKGKVNWFCSYHTGYVLGKKKHTHN